MNTSSVWLKSHGGGNQTDNQTTDNNINIHKQPNNNLFMNYKTINQQFRHARSGSASAESQHSNYTSQRLAHNLKSSSTTENHGSSTVYTSGDTSVFKSSNINSRRSFHMDELQHLETLRLVRRAHQQNQTFNESKAKLQPVKLNKSPPSISQSQQFRYGRRWSPARVPPIVPSRQHNVVDNQNHQQLKNYYRHQINVPIAQNVISKRNSTEETINDNTIKKTGNMSKSADQSTMVSYSSQETQNNQLNDSTRINPMHNRKNSDAISTGNVSFIILNFIMNF